MTDKKKHYTGSTFITDKVVKAAPKTVQLIQKQAVISFHHNRKNHHFPSLPWKRITKQKTVDVSYNNALHSTEFWSQTAATGTFGSWSKVTDYKTGKKIFRKSVKMQKGFIFSLAGNSSCHALPQEAFWIRSTKRIAKGNKKNAVSHQTIDQLSLPKFILLRFQYYAEDQFQNRTRTW